MRELRHINETDMGHSIIFQRMHESQGARKICIQTEFPSEQIESLGISLAESQRSECTSTVLNCHERPFLGSTI